MGELLSYASFGGFAAWLLWKGAQGWYQVDDKPTHLLVAAATFVLGVAMLVFVLFGLPYLFRTL